MTINKKLTSLLAATIMSFSTGIALAEPEPISIELNHSYLCEAGELADITRIAIANPKIADVNVINKKTVNIIAIAPGSTTLNIWTADDMLQEFIITVSPDDEQYAKNIEETINIPGITVNQINGKLVLKGIVRNQNEVTRAASVAAAFAGSPDNVVNMLEMSHPTQINLAALILDITDKDAKELGFKYGNYSGDVSGDVYPLGEFYTFNGGQSYTGGDMHKWANINWRVQALINTGKARILSRPNITTLSGQKAKIQIGGQIPYPITNSNGSSSVEWKDYGIMLEIEPSADSSENITTKVHATVSSIDNGNAVSTANGTYPAITQREVSTVVSLYSGGTMSIGGLMNNSDSKTVAKFPILSSIPVIGEFFKHTSTSKDNHEMIILITPTIVTPDDTVKVSSKMNTALTDTFTSYDRMDDYDLNDPPIPEEVEIAKANTSATNAAIQNTAVTTSPSEYSSESTDPGLDFRKLYARKLAEKMKAAGL